MKDYSFEKANPSAGRKNKFFQILLKVETSIKDLINIMKHENKKKLDRRIKSI